MKKIITILIAILISSCSSQRSGRVCGGPGGKRCVLNTPKKETANYSKSDS